MQLTPYLFFGGRCAAAFNFYKENLGASEMALMTFRGTPGETQMPEEWRDKIMHGSLKIGESVLLASDGMPGQPHEGLKGCAITLTADSEDDAVRLFNALAQGGKVTMPLDKTFFATKFGVLKDQFGVEWMVITGQQS